MLPAKEGALQRLPSFHSYHLHPHTISTWREKQPPALQEHSPNTILCLNLLCTFYLCPSTIWSNISIYQGVLTPSLGQAKASKKQSCTCMQ